MRSEKSQYAKKEIPMSDVLKDTRGALNQLIRMHQLNLELLEQLDAIYKWIFENRITMRACRAILDVITCILRQNT